ncbi:hypothetical protein GEV33_001456 [Tenebrio molitor]|uniref:Uncharacterized protein n=1 Tax=Tenebrio molitor TaxID=7067 RepID=A0A8J6HM91_TENMO|nr:hypothetical protein GEV33_001456 [Tenebrio molitor]
MALLQRRIRGTRSATAERAAVPQVAEKRITCVAFGIRNHPRERIADAMVLIVRRCQVSGASKSPKIFTVPITVTVLPISRDPSSSRERERGSSIQFTVPYREGVPESPPSNYRGAPPLSRKELFVEFTGQDYTSSKKLPGAHITTHALCPEKPPESPVLSLAHFGS